MIKFRPLRDYFWDSDFSLKSAIVRPINNQHNISMAGPQIIPLPFLMLNDSPVNMDFMLELFG